jgi:uncharacterized DUF497 family protein
MELEWDEAKNRTNRQKHGFDFEEARDLDWGNAIYVEDGRFPYPEPRYWAFAMRGGRLHMVAFCRHGAELNHQFPEGKSQRG